MSIPKDTQSERLTLLELVAYWEGKVNTTLLTRHFGISRQYASVDLKRYRDLAPGNLRYSPSDKSYLANTGFSPCFINSDPSQYLNWLSIGYVERRSHNVSNEALTLPPRQVSPEIMRGLVCAIREKRRLDVDYVSLSNPDRQGRIIAPHSFVKTGLRWHLRAWCEKKQSYRDFVLSRFRGAPDLMGKSPNTEEQDEAWNTKVTLIFQPDPRLSPAKRQVLEHDYQMCNGELRIITRACLAQYLLNEMQVNTKVLDGTPEAQQLVLVNQADIREWLFEG
ncbi:WYL domain-containing protein [Marinimicrobium sp. ARAG 43.8]|uniref:WYL domain-containing protein n=1 Tax=Marinimicrobium sp. ARAG 43.8 TaxID=3418719 RepID=UPI003CF1DC4C